MSEAQKIDLAYSDGHWLTQVGDGFIIFDCSTLMQLIKTVQNAFPGEQLLFVVDYTTIEYHLDAEAQLLAASQRSDALVIASVQEF